MDDAFGFGCGRRAAGRNFQAADGSGRTWFRKRQNRLYARGRHGHTRPMMRKALQFGSLAAAVLQVGCGTTSTVTLLSPRTQVRNAEGLYPVEIEFRSNMQALKKETLKPYLQVGDNNYPMRRTPRLDTRWETLLPVPATNSVMDYRVKVDFEYNAIPAPRSNSVLSQPYRLQIKEK